MVCKILVLATLMLGAALAQKAAVSHIKITHPIPHHGHHEASHSHGHYTYQAPAAQTYHAPEVQSYHAPTVQTYHAPAVQTYHQVAPAVHQAAPAPVAHHHHHGHEEEHHAPAYYSFEYSVHDPHTHDIKEQKEERHGDVVKGMYSLIEPDGSKRIVEYTADKHSGFHAVVHREHSHHPAPAKKVEPYNYHH